jgi:hypothetical protein
LEILNTVDSLKSRELASKVLGVYYSDLPQDLLNQKTSSGANVLLDRILWGKSYLKMAKFVTYPKRGMVQITEKGKRQLATGRLPLQDLQNDEDFVAHRESVKSEKENEIELQSVNVENASPQDLIDSGFSSIETEVKTNLLERLKEIDPYYLTSDVKQIKMNETNNLFSQLLDRIKAYDWHDGSDRLDFMIKDTRDLIIHGEPGVALDNICQNLYEFSVEIKKQDYDDLKRIGELMKMQSTIWKILKELIA